MLLLIQLQQHVFNCGVMQDPAVQICYNISIQNCATRATIAGCRALWGEHEQCAEHGVIRPLHDCYTIVITM